MLNTQLEHIKTEFKPQTWHVELHIPARDGNVLSAFHSRSVAEETRDEWNAENNRVGFQGDAFICLCDCPNRECLWL